MHLPKRAALWALEFVVVVAVLLVAIFTFGPSLEEKYGTPMFTNVVGNLVSVNTLHTDILVTGVKSRNCQLVAASVLVDVKGAWIVGIVQMLNENGEKLEVEAQRLIVGAPFVRLVRVDPATEAVKIRVEGRCHPFWLTTQNFIELDGSKTPAQVR